MLCECGCGTVLPPLNARGKPPRFVHGHNGRTRGSTPLAERFWRHVERAGPDACWFWTGTIGRHGYGSIGDGAGRMARAHRVAWTLTHGPIPRGDGYHGICVLHRCDTRHCVNPAHLFLGTNDDNMADMMAKNRSAAGERSARARLTRSQALAIRESHQHPNALATLYGVQPCTVRNIRAGRIWKHV